MLSHLPTEYYRFESDGVTLATCEEHSRICLCHICMASRTPWEGKQSDEGLRIAKEGYDIEDVDVAIIVNDGPNQCVSQETGKVTAGGVTWEIEDIDRTGTAYVVVHPSLDSITANECVWHELAHLAQRKQLGHDDFERQYEFWNEAKGYYNNPFEVEARDIAWMMREQMIVR